MFYPVSVFFVDSRLIDWLHQGITNSYIRLASSAKSLIEERVFSTISGEVQV